MYTGVAIIAKDKTVTFYERTEVTFWELTEEEIDAYVASKSLWIKPEVMEFKVKDVYFCSTYSRGLL